MKQTYRIGVYLNENKLKISILHGCKNICNIEYLIYDTDLLLINLVASAAVLPANDLGKLNCAITCGVRVILLL